MFMGSAAARPGQEAGHQGVFDGAPVKRQWGGFWGVQYSECPEGVETLFWLLPWCGSTRTDGQRGAHCWASTTVALWWYQCGDLWFQEVCQSPVLLFCPCWWRGYYGICTTLIQEQYSTENTSNVQTEELCYVNKRKKRIQHSPLCRALSFTTVDLYTWELRFWAGTLSHFCLS